MTHKDLTQYVMIEMGGYEKYYETEGKYLSSDYPNVWVQTPSKKGQDVL